MSDFVVPRCPCCRRELAAFVPRRRWVCVWCGLDQPFVEPVRAAEPLPKRPALGREQDPPYVSWERERFTPRQALALLRLKLDRDRLLQSECGVATPDPHPLPHDG